MPFVPRERALNNMLGALVPETEPPGTLTLLGLEAWLRDYAQKVVLPAMLGSRPTRESQYYALKLANAAANFALVDEEGIFNNMDPFVVRPAATISALFFAVTMDRRWKSKFARGLAPQRTRGDGGAPRPTEIDRSYLRTG